MLNRLPRILRPPQQQRILTRRLLQRQLIQRQTLTPRLLDPCPRGRSEMECCDGHGLDFQQTRIVRDGADYDEGFLGAGETLEAREGHWGAVDAGHEEAAEDDAVECRGSAACV